MISLDDMPYLGEQWGSWLFRSTQKAWPSRSLMARIAEEGSVGAAIKSHEQFIPVNDMPEDILRFHKAVHQVSMQSKHLLYIAYYDAGGVKEKVRALGIPESTYRHRLSAARLEAWQAIMKNERIAASG